MPPIDMRRLQEAGFDVGAAQAAVEGHILMVRAAAMRGDVAEVEKAQEMARAAFQNHLDAICAQLALVRSQMGRSL